MRMDKYKEETDEVEVPSNDIQDEYSRTEKNNRIYHESYSNSSVIDISKGVSNLFREDEEEVLVEEEIPKEIYIAKNYDVDDYIAKAHENKENDNLMRSLVDTDYDVNKVNEKQDEISKLIEKIEEKEQQEEFFSDLMPDNNSDTVVTDPIMLDDRLDTLIGDETFINYAKEQEEKQEEEESFKDILEKKHHLPKKLPLFIFIGLVIVLIVVIILIIIK